MAAVIDVENISKRFFFGERNQTTFLEEMTERAKAFMAALGKREGVLLNSSKHDFWALQDISFNVYQGQTLAIIGHNGAGKSTLLKILSRITQPTTGMVRAYGRLASLLEVGAGFHPEFSGRDNVYLNGAMLGLSRKEIQTRFDRIVEFSELEEFIDIPVKHYSTGMYIRLAFAVAAHLNPEIVILDEVLAVGDATFQKKCLGRMTEIVEEGHAAILVTHSMEVVRRSSQMCLWLKHGRVAMFGPTYEVADAYESEVGQLAINGAPIARFVSWMAEGRLSWTPHSICAGQKEVTFRFEVELVATISDGQLGISFADAGGLVLFTQYLPLEEREPGKMTIILTLPSLPLNEGSYNISCLISSGGSCFAIRGTPELTVLAGRGIAPSAARRLRKITGDLRLEGVRSK
jgi:lipopolysaccharide transport system ATP-binding protein